MMSFHIQSVQRWRKRFTSRYLSSSSDFSSFFILSSSTGTQYAWYNSALPYSFSFDIKWRLKILKKLSMGSPSAAVFFKPSTMRCVATIETKYRHKYNKTYSYIILLPLKTDEYLTINGLNRVTAINRLRCVDMCDILFGFGYGWNICT